MENTKSILGGFLDGSGCGKDDITEHIIFKRLLARKKWFRFFLLYCWIWPGLFWIGLVLPSTSLFAGDLVVNGNFETPLVNPWTTNQFYIGVNFPSPHMGNNYAYFGAGTNGITELANATGILNQTVHVPSDTTALTLEFYLYITTSESNGLQNDKLYIEILDNAGNLHESIANYSNLNSSSGYTQKAFALNPSFYANKIIRIQFRGTSNGSNKTVFRIDDVKLTQKACVSSLTSPLPASVLFQTFPQEFCWTSSSDCSPVYLLFATTSAPSQTKFFLTSSSCKSITSDDWVLIKNAIGSTSGTYYWAIGESVGGGFSARTEWRPFAEWASQRFILTLETEPVLGGTLTADPLPNTDGKYAAGSVVALSATASQNFSFNGWQFTSGQGSPSDSYNNATRSASVNLLSDRTIKGTFTRGGYNVNVVSGLHGSVEPKGNISVSVGGQLLLKAAPDPNYVIDQWTVDGVVTPNEGTSLSLTGINSDKTVSVSFKELLYVLTISASHGAVTKNPDQATYSPHVKVELTPIPESDYIFVGWSGDSLGSGSPLTVEMSGNKSITAIFNQRPAPPTLKAPPLTALASFSFDFDSVNGWNCIVESCHDGENWFADTLLWGDGTKKTATVLKSLESNFGMCRLNVESLPNTAPFLSFPIRNVIDPYTAPITAIFDHEWQKTGIIRTYRNEIAKTPLSGSNSQGLEAYLKNSLGTTPFNLEFNYNDKTTFGGKVVLWYDNHLGYDYSFDATYEVIAAADGRIDRVLTKTMAQYHGLVIIHNNNFKTFYLHLSDWAPGIEEYINSTSPTPFYVKEGNFLGHPGNTGVPGAKKPTDFVHLHLTVWDDKDQRVDPYGEFTKDNKLVKSILWKIHPQAQ